MNKKTFDRKTAEKYILDSRNCGKTDQEIYNELTQKFNNKKSIARLITRTTTIEKKNKYRIYNYILLILIGLFITLRTLSILDIIDQTENDAWGFLVILIVLFIFACYVIYRIAIYDGLAYRLCGFFTCVTFFLNDRFVHNDAEWIINMIFSIAIIFFSFYLAKKMFPYRRLRNLKKDKDGEYILNS